MRCVVVVSVAVCLTALMPASGSAQGLLGVTDGGFRVGKVVLVPSIKIGIQRFGMNFSTDMPEADYGPGRGHLEWSPVELRVSDGRLWFGSVGLEARLNQAFAFVSLEGNAERKLRVQTPFEPEQAVTVDWEVPGALWEGTRLEWWAFDVGGGFQVGDGGVAVIGGFKHDHFGLGLEDPRGDDLDWAPPVRRSPDLYKADLLVKQWIPYGGLQLIGPNYRGTLIGSPFAWVSFKLPFVYLDRYFDPPLDDTDLARYELFTMGYFIEASYEYLLDVGGSFDLILWGRANWLRYQGSGDQVARSFDYSPGNTPFSGIQSGRATFSRYTYGVGITGTLAF